MDLLSIKLDTIQKGAGIKAPSNIGSLISTALPYVFSIAGILLLIYLVVGGLQLMTSKGDPKGVQAAQAKITNALIGFLVVFLSYTIVLLLGRVFNIQAFSEIFK